jgi:transcriptional regulator with XRE-family HTH domain
MAKKRADGSPPGSPVNETARVFGERMKARREELGLSLYAMAKRTGLSAQGLGKIEQAVHEPSWSTVQLVVELLGLSFDDVRNSALKLRDYTPLPTGRPRKAEPVEEPPAKPAKPTKKGGAK